MIPLWLYELEDDIYYEGCTEDAWIEALESGMFTDGWYYRHQMAQRQLLFYTSIGVL